MGKILRQYSFDMKVYFPGLRKKGLLERRGMADCSQVILAEGKHPLTGFGAFDIIRVSPLKFGYSETSARQPFHK